MNIFNALLIIILTIVIAKIAVYVLKQITKLTSKTKTDLDDHIIQALSGPLQVIIVITGIYFSTIYILPDLLIYNFDLSKGFFIIVAILIASTLSKILTTIINWYQKEISVKTKTDLDDTFIPIIKKLINIIIFGISFVIILDKLNVNISPILASLGVAGLAVGLALQDTLSNFFSAIHISLDRPVKVGDYVEIETGTKGYIEEVGWRSTKIRTISGNYIIFPNSKLSQSVITNYEGPKPELSVTLNVGVSYHSDLGHVERVTIEVVKKVLADNEGGVKTFEPLVRFKNLNDSTIDFTVIFKAKSYMDQFKIKHEFIKELMIRYKKENIEIPFPQRDVHIFNNK